MAKKELKNVSDSDMDIFFEKEMRGGICYAAKKHSVANESVQTKYDDMNNLYDKAMIEYLPYDDFRQKKVTDKNIDIVWNKKDNASHGFFLEVDMYCPDELHDEQNDFPIAPDKLKVTKEMLSPE